MIYNKFIGLAPGFLTKFVENKLKAQLVVSLQHYCGRGTTEVVVLL